MRVKEVLKIFRGRPWVNAVIAILQIVVILAAGSQFLEILEKATLEEFVHEQLAMAGEANGEIKLYLEFLSGAMKARVRIPEVVDFDEKYTRKTLKLAIQELSPLGVIDIEVLDEKGVLRYSIENREMEGQDYSSRQIFRETKGMTGNDTHIIGFNEFIGSDPDKKEILVSVPMFRARGKIQNADTKGSFSGVIVCTLKFKMMIEKVISRIKFLERGHPFLIDEKFKVLWSPQRFLLGKDLLKEAGDFPSFQRVLKDMVDGNSGVAEYTFYRYDEGSNKHATESEEKIISYVSVRLGEKRWTLGVWSPKEDARNFIRSTYVKQLLLGLLVILIILVGPTYSLVMSFRYSKSLEREVEAKTMEFRESHQRLLTVLDSLDAAVYVADMDTYEILFVNKYKRDRHGDAVGRICWKVFQENENEKGPCDFCTNEKLLKPEGRPAGSNVWEFQKSSSGKWYQVRDRAITWVDGRTVRLEIATDITDRKRVEEELRHTSDKLSSLLESLPVIVPYTCLADNGFGITYVSNAVEEITGYKPHQVIGDPKFWAERIHPNDRERVLEELHALKKEGNVSCEYSFRSAEGSYKLLSDTRNLVKLPDGTVSHIAGTWQDITERNRLREKSLNRRRKETEYGFGKIVGSSPPMREIFERISKIIELDVKTVLILGETGTGKDLLARAIHEEGRRKDHPFTEINCANIPDNLLESELFGYEKGAFTDAKSMKRGLFEQAPMGTILLNEIGHMKLDLQTKLLRVIEERKFRRVGGVKDLDLDVQLLAATNKGLWDAVKAGEFREDLYYRLDLIPIHMPPLRERKEDIPLLTRHFIRTANQVFKKEVKGITREAEELMIRYDWPGNVREYKNAVERAIILGDEDRIQVKHLPKEVISGHGAEVGEARFKLPEKGVSLSEVERGLIEQALDRTGGNQIHTARLLGVSRHAIRHRMKKYGLM